ncbi:MAG: shikimate dehydrogenase [Chloroflexia bacterium]|nr:shikimate dehydrogenase [Chloroflexia bacterium]
MIDGETRLVGLIGWPVAHSLSPALHNAAFAAEALNWRYLPLPVRPGEVAPAVRGLAALGFRGANVTVPHKRAVLEALDVLSPEAAALGAVNTIVVEHETEGRPVLQGHNTDVPGFIEALRAGGFEPQATRAVVVGAGGAARAAVYGLLQAGCHHVTIVNRSYERAYDLIVDLDVPDPAELETESCGLDNLVEAAYQADLLVNATPVGLWPQAEETIWPAQTPFPAHLTVLDMVYHPNQTRLLQQAQRAGARAIGGLDMLLRQGARSWELWTGRPAPLEVMRAACEPIEKRR